ncbi:MAG: hypothetical protein MUF78_08965 [Candidatus Edwardsbacteria bacterium]|nr:hypothetical protein [Candidatus Edwardsbacteria bacterium]
MIVSQATGNASGVPTSLQIPGARAIVAGWERRRLPYDSSTEPKSRLTAAPSRCRSHSASPLPTMPEPATFCSKSDVLSYLNSRHLVAS